MSDEIWGFLVSGGPIMVPIGFLSVICFGVFIERLLVLRMRRICPKKWAKRVRNHFSAGDVEEAVDMCRVGKTSLSRLFQLTFANQGKSRSELKVLVEERGRIEIAQLEKNISVMGTIASVAPLLGLMGTVWGMILTFEAIQSEGMGSVSGLAGGISQALVTTFAGLAVGIPAFIAHRWANRRIDLLAMGLEEESLKLISLMTATSAEADSEELGSEREMT